LINGQLKDVFMKYKNGDIFLGKQWAGPVRYIDFFHPSAEEYWK